MNVINSSRRRRAEAALGIQRALRAFSGACSARVVNGGDTMVDEHSHDWPVLSLYVMGGYRKIFDGGDVEISGPSVVLHGSGEAHANHLGPVGLEQIDIQFDPRWLGKRSASHAFDGIRCWIGGPVAAAGRQLAASWSNADVSETQLAGETRRFLGYALSSPEERHPAWLPGVSRRLQFEQPPTASQLAREFDLHPSWLAQAYRRHTGEGLRETLQRRRVEYATGLLRTSDLSPAAVAAEAGFCDQSHMNRAFRSLLGRTPLQVRGERAALMPAAL